MKTSYKNFSWKKPFIRLTDQNEGYVKNAVVIYGKRPLLYHTRQLNEEESLLKGYAIEQYPVTFTHWLRVDLFFFIFEWEWFTAIKEK